MTVRTDRAQFKFVEAVWFESGRHTLLLVPMDSPGLSIVRIVPVMQHQAIDGHCELLFRDVRVPVASRLGDQGVGFALAQLRLGPGRVHHTACAASASASWRSL
jgi:alkylation response protein AidB-like acyl-CoA dehydrogenase